MNNTPKNFSIVNNVSDNLFTCLATPHALTPQVSPAELLYGRPFRTKLNIKNFASPPASVHPAVLRDRVSQKEAKMKNYVDRRHGAQSSQFKLGSYVRSKKTGIIKTYELLDGKVWNAIHLFYADYPCCVMYSHSDGDRNEDWYVSP